MSRDDFDEWNGVITDEEARQFHEMTDASKVNYQEVLSYIDPDCDYGDWVKVGMGLKYASDQGANVDVETFEGWSSQGAKYKPGEPSYKWKTFDSTGSNRVTHRTILQMAQEAGCDLAALSRNTEPPRRVKRGKMTKQTETKKEVPNKSDDTNKRKEILDTLHGQEFEELYNRCSLNLENDSLFNSTIGKRGISKEIAREYDIFPVVDEWIGKEHFDEGVIFFGSKGSYIFRSNQVEVNERGNSKKFRKPKGLPFIQIGLKRVIEKKDEMLDGDFPAPVFLCEGVFDAPSFSEGANCDAIGLAGTDGLDALIAAYQEYNIQRPLIVTLDNDEAGRANQTKVVEKLTKAGIPCVGLNLIPKDLRDNEEGPTIKDPNDFLLFDKKRFKEYVGGVLEDYYRRSDNIEAVPVGFYFDAFIDHILENAAAPSIETGFSSLDSDELLGGGLYAGLYIIGAISSLGKTTLTLQIANQIAAAGHDVLFFSLEMSRDELIAKGISRYTAEIANRLGQSTRLAKTTRGILNARQYILYSQEEKELIEKAQEGYFNDVGGTFYVIEGQGDISANMIELKAKNHVKRTGRTPVIFVDYLQIMAQPRDVKQHLTDKQIVDANVFNLKRLSRELNTPVIAVSSLNRMNYNAPISMVAFKESGAIEYTSDVLIGLEREVDPTKKDELKKARDLEYQTGIKYLRLKILKNRNGKQGGAALLTYDARFNYYYDDRIEGV